MLSRVWFGRKRKDGLKTQQKIKKRGFLTLPHIVMAQSPTYEFLGRGPPFWHAMNTIGNKKISDKVGENVIVAIVTWWEKKPRPTLSMSCVIDIDAVELSKVRSWL